MKMPHVGPTGLRNLWNKPMGILSSGKFKNGIKILIRPSSPRLIDEKQKETIYLYTRFDAKVILVETRTSRGLLSMILSLSKVSSLNR